VKTLTLPKPAVLSADSFSAARAVLVKAWDTPVALVATPEDANQAAEWLKVAKPQVEVRLVPSEALKGPHVWCLEGHRHVVVSMVP